MRLRVLHVLGELRPSGAETMLKSAGKRFVQLGVQSDILETGAHDGPFKSELVASGYKVIHIPFRKSPFFLFEFLRLLKRNNYDVVHLHTERANFWLALVVMLSQKKVIIRTIHSTFSFEGHLRWRRGLQRRALDKLGVKHVAISPKVHDNEMRRFGINAVIIPNWIAESMCYVPDSRERAESRSSIGVEGNDTVVISIGNCSKVKNHETIIKALAMIEKESRPIYLHIGIEDDAASERQLVDQLGLTDNVRFLGFQEDVHRYLTMADLFIMPSIYEGFGIAAIEAVASGLPCILADVAGLSDFKSMFNGIIYCNPDVESVHSALETYLGSDKEEIKWKCVKNAAVVKNTYSLDKGVDAYYQLYTNEQHTPLR